MNAFTENKFKCYILHVYLKIGYLKIYFLQKSPQYSPVKVITRVV